MAKAKEIEGLDCNADAVECAARVLLGRFDEVVGFRDAALDFSDIKGVHDMRVATRRLRSALLDFTHLMNKRPLKQPEKDLKETADMLGEVRDHDVAIAALEKFEGAAENESVKEGVGKLLRERRGLREIARLDLAEILADENFSGLRERFAAAVARAASRKESDGFVSLRDAGRRVIAGNLQNFLDLGASLYDPFNRKSLHKFRIAAKRLRYSIHLFVACWGEGIAPFAKEISRMQSFLGKVHDCDVWIDILGERLRENKALSPSDFQAAASYRPN